MKAFRVGFIVSLSFLLLLAIITGTLGFFPPPKGPKPPEYPKYPSYNSSDQAAYTKQQADYAEASKKYDEDTKAYQDQQKSFTEKKIIPYARNVFIAWIGIVVVFEIIGLLFVQFNSSLVGGGFAFTGFWAVVFGPIGGLMWYASALVSSFARTSSQEFSSDPVLQAICLASFMGALILSAVGFVLENRNKPLFV